MSAYLSRHALNERDMAHVIVKNRANGVHNELAEQRKGVMLDEDRRSRVIARPIKRLGSSPRTSGAAAIVVGDTARPSAPAS